MKKQTIYNLRKKGWKEEEINDAKQIMDESRIKDKSRSSHNSNMVLYWSIIFLAIISNMVISIILIPFLLVINKLALDVIIIVIGFAFGSLFNLVITDIQYVSRKHHIIAGITIPVLALINISTIVKVANAINEVLRLNVIRDNPYTISILYVIAFMLPYLWTLFVKKKWDLEYKNKSIYPDKSTEKEFEEKYK